MSGSDEKFNSDEEAQRRILYGGFQRTLPLPEGVNADQVEAEAALPRHIPVKGTDEWQSKNLAA